MRQDARRRRDTLVRVAAEVFDQEGQDVPLEVIADKAGIGRGTLYRNFKDRSQLALEVMRMRLEELAAEIDGYGNDPQAFVPFLARVGLLSAMNAADCTMELEADLRLQRDEIVKRAGQLFAIPLRNAQAAGTIRPEVTVEDMHRIARMLQAIGASVPMGQRSKAVAEALDLIVKGIGSRG